jgi:hypothetical protein
MAAGVRGLRGVAPVIFAADFMEYKLLFWPGQWQFLAMW